MLSKNSLFWYTTKGLSSLTYPTNIKFCSKLLPQTRFYSSKPPLQKQPNKKQDIKNLNNKNRGTKSPPNKTPPNKQDKSENSGGKDQKSTNSHNTKPKAEGPEEKETKGDGKSSIFKPKKHEYVKGAPFSRRSSSTSKWITRQLKDPYVKQAHAEGMVSRAAYKLQEMNKQLRILRPGYSVLDLGAAPGGWTQVATFIVREKPNGRVISVDINDMQEIAGSTFLKLDFTTDESIKTILKTLKGKKVDTVLSDMAPSYSGQNDIDHARLMALSNRALDISKFILNNGGNFLVKISRGGTEKEFIEKLKKCFRQVKMVKPPASRQESSEIYASAKGFSSKATLDDPKVQELKKNWNVS